MRGYKEDAEKINIYIFAKQQSFEMSPETFPKSFQDTTCFESLINRLSTRPSRVQASFFCNRPDSQSTVFSNYNSYSFHTLIIFFFFYVDGLPERGLPSTFPRRSFERIVPSKNPYFWIKRHVHMCQHTVWRQRLYVVCYVRGRFRKYIRTNVHCSTSGKINDETDNRNPHSDLDEIIGTWRLTAGIFVERIERPAGFLFRSVRA